ncbi:MAG: hypothetical protein ABJB03_07710 [Rhodoglobus sp.]
MTQEFGIGAQVVVRDEPSGDVSPWRNEPTGVIVRAGGSAIGGVWGKGAAGGRIWVISFDEPATTSDGEGPFESAQVHERFLELAPPITD